MAHVVVEDGQVVIRLAWWERAAARRGDDVRVPLTAVRRVTVESDWWRALSGTHERGTCVPDALCVGTRRHQAGKDFVAIRPRRPVVCIELWSSAPFRLLAVSARDNAEAEASAGQLRRTAPRIDISTPWRQPLPVPDDRAECGRGAGESLRRHFLGFLPCGMLFLLLALALFSVVANGADISYIQQRGECARSSRAAATPERASLRTHGPGVVDL